MTTATFKDTDDIEAGIKKEFPNGTLADWNQLDRDYRHVSNASLTNWMDEIGLKRTEEAHVVKGGKRQYGGGRNYFICRWDGNVRSGWLAHEDINCNTLCLGSWYDLTFRALVQFKD